MTAADTVGTQLSIAVKDHAYMAFKPYPDGSAAYPAAGETSTSVKIARVMPCHWGCSACSAPECGRACSRPLAAARAGTLNAAATAAAAVARGGGSHGVRVVPQGMADTRTEGSYYYHAIPLAADSTPLGDGGAAGASGASSSLGGTSNAGASARGASGGVSGERWWRIRCEYGWRGGAGGAAQ
jgi:hypothetical protein